MPDKISKLILPFSALPTDRSESFPEEMEKTTVYCLAELDRGKGSGILSKQPVENVRYIAKVCYPLWVIPFREISIVIDGLNVSSHIFSYPRIQNIKAFIDSVERSCSSRQIYTAFLSDNLNYFQIIDREDKKTVKGLVADPTFLQDFNLYLSQAEPLGFPPTDLLAVAPAIDETAIPSMQQELELLKSRFSEEIKTLEKSMKLVNSTTVDFVKKIEGEIGETNATFNAEVEKFKAPVQETVKEIRNKCDAEITLVSQKFGNEILLLQKERIKHQKTKNHLIQRIARYEAEIKSSSARKDSASKRKWKEEQQKVKKELSKVESEIKGLDKGIKETEDRKSLDIIAIKAECDAKALDATKELVEIESSRDAKVQILMQEKAKIEESTSLMIKQVDTTARLIETAMNSFDMIGIPQRNREYSLVYIPFYLVCFQSETGKRYMTISPSNVNSVKLLTRLKGALGKAKIKQLFNPRSTAITSFLNNFQNRMEENAVFKRGIDEDAAKVDMLQTNNSLESVGSGLNKLMAEGWVSEKEHESFIQRLPQTQS